jgi:hypothetical protein
VKLLLISAGKDKPWAPTANPGLIRSIIPAMKVKIVEIFLFMLSSKPVQGIKTNETDTVGFATRSPEP